MSSRLGTAMAMAFRDQLRRPLVPILLVAFPTFIIIWSVAITQPDPRRVELPGGAWVATTMKALHGPEMAKISVAFVAALIGVFLTQSALQGDRRLIVAGLRAREVVLARLAVLGVATVVVVAASALASALHFTPASWPVIIAALVLLGVIYGGIGTIAGALLDRLAATYLILFVALTDLGVVQTPMFHTTPSRWAILLPGYGPTRLVLDGAYSDTFHATGDLILALAWVAILCAMIFVVLRRALVAGRAGT